MKTLTANKFLKIKLLLFANAESQNELMNNENSCEFPIILKFMFITTKREDFFFLKCIAHFIIQRRKRIKKVNKQLH